MLISKILSIFHQMVENALSLNPWSFNMNYVLAFLRFASMLNKFLPITEAVIPIATVYVGVFSFLVWKYGLLAFLNLVRGSGVKL